MTKRPFIRKQKRKRHGASFWDFEYTEGGHLKLSDAPAGDLLKFCRFIERHNAGEILAKDKSVVDFGCGNGRHLIYLAEKFGMNGVGYDISEAGIALAVEASKGYDIQYQARSIAGEFPALADESQVLALDMMTSHFLNASERTFLREEAFRCLVPGGYLFMKAHLADGDLHTRRLMADSPAKEAGSYIHPVMGVAEHVYWEEELMTFLGEQFEVKKVYRSHKHISHGQARKRRTIAVYAQKPLW